MKSICFHGLAIAADSSLQFKMKVGKRWKFRDESLEMMKDSRWKFAVFLVLNVTLNVDCNHIALHSMYSVQVMISNIRELTQAIIKCMVDVHIDKGVKRIVIYLNITKSAMIQWWSYY